MAKIKIGSMVFDVSEDAMMLLGMDRAGQVKLAWPCATGSQEAMAKIAETTISSHSVTRVAFVKAEYIFIADELTDKKPIESKG